MASTTSFNSPPAKGHSMINLHVHHPTIQSDGGFIAASSDKRLHAYPVSDPLKNVSVLRWPRYVDDAEIIISHEIAREYSRWLEKAHAFTVACEKGMYVFRAKLWTLDLMGIDTRNYSRYTYEDVSAEHGGFVVYKGSVPTSRVFGDADEATAFFALFDSYLEAMAEINDGHFHLA